MMPHNRKPSWMENEAWKDNRWPSERGGEVVAVVVIGLIVFFFYAH